MNSYMYECNGWKIAIWTNNNTIYIGDGEGSGPDSILISAKLNDIEVDNSMLGMQITLENNKWKFIILYESNAEEEFNHRLEKTRQQIRAKEDKNEKSKKISKKESKIKEETTMANNFFNTNMEFGQNTDENIASTIMGVAVKHDNSWRIYDKKRKEITDVGEMQLGNLPIFIMPTIKLKEGDLIKSAGEYYFVIETNAGSTQTLCAKTGEMKTIIPIKNVLGFSCYSKVIALGDSIMCEDGDFDIEKMAIMSAMSGGQNNEQMNQLVPLMLFKDKLDGDDDMMKMILMSVMMSPTEGNEQNAMNQFLPLMLMKENDSGNEDMMKMMLMSSMMGGNMAGSNNPAMNYLMLEMLMSKEKTHKSAQTYTENSE